MSNLARLPAQAYVYVIGPKSGPQKIGVAGDPKRRLGIFQVGNAEALRVAGAFSVERDEAGLVESYAHWLLRDCAVRGEWFDCSPAEAAAAIEAALAATRAGKRAPLERSDARILLPLTPKMLAAIDAIRGAQPRTAFIREAIEREIKRRSRTQSPKP